MNRPSRTARHGAVSAGASEFQFRREFRSLRRATPLQKNRHPRRAAILVIAIVCLTLLSMTITVLVRGVAMNRDQSRRMLHQVQAEWLAHAAAQSAADQLRRNRQWEGARWTIDLQPPSELTAAVQVDLQPVEAGPDRAAVPDRRQAFIQVDCPPAAANRVRAEQLIVIEIPKPQL